jgi:ribosomal protein S18 acetylase RimI-like enzyme
MITLRAVDQRVAHATFLEAFADYAMGAPRTTEEQFFLRMQKNAVDYDLSVGAYDSGRMVGFTLIGVDSWGGALTAYDAGTGIVPKFRGQRLACRMLDHALPTLHDRGVERFALEVLQQNEPAIKAYRKAGFETTRELHSYVADVAPLTARETSSFVLRSIDDAQFGAVAAETDWVPSFENRVSAIRAISDAVSLTGAFDGDTCVGVYAYSAPLRWLLSLVVARSHRRRGVGSALVAHVAANVPRGVARIAVLNVDGADAGMQQFLRRLGFTPLVDQFEMERPLRRAS